jgi:hypothetical protein
LAVVENGIGAAKRKGADATFQLFAHATESDELIVAIVRGFVVAQSLVSLIATQLRDANRSRGARILEVDRIVGVQLEVGLAFRVEPVVEEMIAAFGKFEHATR